MPMPASLVNRTPLSTRSKAFRKSTKTTCTPLYGLSESVSLYQSYVMLASALIVDLSAVKACWEALRLRSFRFSLSWILSSTLANCGKTEICLKSLFISVGLSTLQKFIFLKSAESALQCSDILSPT